MAFLLFLQEGNRLKLYLLAVLLRIKQLVYFILLGSIDLKHEIISLTEVTMGAIDQWCVAVCDCNGTVTFVFVSITMNDGEVLGDDLFNTSFNPSPAFVIEPFSKNIVLRAHSQSLVAILQKIDNRCLEIQVWSSLPACHIKSSELEDAIFKVTKIPFDNLRVNDTILDFRWVESGYLDSFPWLVTFNRRSSIVHRCVADSLQWVPLIEISHTTIFSSHLKSPSLVTESSYESISSPADVYLYIIPAIKEIASANDESHHICSDWHPDFILAMLCTKETGVKVAFQKHIEGLFTWLSHWLSPDESARPQWNSQLS